MCRAHCKERSTYHAHFFWLHFDAVAREALKAEVVKKQADNPLAFCPEKGCKRNYSASERELVYHWALDHEHLDAHLRAANRSSELERINIESVSQAVLAAPLMKRSTELQSTTALKQEEWKVTERCPVCNQSLFKTDTFKRTVHFLDHFLKDIKSIITETTGCRVCKKTFSDQKTCAMHFGTEHGFFDKFIREHRTGYRSTKEHRPGYNSEFARFIMQQRTSPKSSAAAAAPASVPTREKWDEVNYCVICPDSKKLKSRKDLMLHYTYHFKDYIAKIFESELSGVDLERVVVCPYPACPVKIERTKGMTEENLLVQLYQHIGFVHQIISGVFLSDVKYKLESFSNAPIDHNRFWAISKGDCHICGENLSIKSLKDRLKHYNTHLQSFYPSGQCYSCKEVYEDSNGYRLHVLSQHVGDKIKENIRIKGLDFKCAFCPLTSDSPDTLVNHIINEERYLDVVIMADMLAEEKKGPGAKDLKVKKARRIVTAAPESEPAEAEFKECLFCHKFIKNKENFFKRHLYKVHFQTDIDQKMEFYFPAQSRGVDAKCRVCKEVLPTNQWSVHVGDHEKLYTRYEAALKKTDEDDLDTESNELTTLGQDGDDVDRVEQAFRQQLRTMKRSRECFIQPVPCYLFGDKLPPCHECKKIEQGANYELSGTCCCFEGFRKIRFIENGIIIIVGYLDPYKDPKVNDIDIWVPKSELSADDLSEEEAFYILKKVGNLICDIIVDERQMKEVFMNNNRSLVWKRLHQGVREMCDVCSTTVYNLHFTCSRCGVLVCCDCFLARMKGTKYKSINAVTKRTRTRKRFRSGLDMNLWPLCLNNQIHDIDKLVMTQMSPGSATEDLLDNIHSIRAFYQLECDCKDCTSPAAQGSSEICGLADDSILDVISKCPDCHESLEDFSKPCKQLHLMQHIKGSVSVDRITTHCKTCNIETGNSVNFLIHSALVHNVVEAHYTKVLVEKENERQDSVVLGVDSHRSCQICLKDLSQDDMKKVRFHYLGHLSENLLDSVKAVGPYSCDTCGHVEHNRQRLMLHLAFYHKKLDSALTVYLVGGGNTSMKSLESWEDIPNCIKCRTTLENLSLGQKRIHYVREFHQDLEEMINKQHDNIVKRGAPYRCRQQGCNFIVEASASPAKDKTRFLTHMGTTHRMIDTIMTNATKGMIQTKNLENNVDILEELSGKCEICDEMLESIDSPDALKSAKNHYYIHFKDHIEETYDEIFSSHKIPMNCPYEGCQFSTEIIDTEQFGHHKKNLIKHMGSFHELFKKFVTQCTSSRKNYEMSNKFLADKTCNICFIAIEGGPEGVIRHYYDHFAREIIKEYKQEIMDDSETSQLSCPLCDKKETRSMEPLEDFVKHMGIEHGLFDNKIKEYTRRLDYFKEASCRVCGKDFSKDPSKSKSIEKHYAEHFLVNIEDIYPDLSSGKCPMCKQKKVSTIDMVMHLGTEHGYFCRLIEKHHWKEEDNWNDDSVEVETDVKKAFTVEHEHALSKCFMCSAVLKVGNSERLDCEMRSAQKKHLVSHMAVNTKDIDNEAIINKKLAGFYSTEYAEHSELFFVPIDSSVVATTDNLAFKREDPIHHRMTKCHICYNSFTSLDHLAVELHLMRHYSTQLVSIMNQTKNERLSCDTSLPNKITQLMHFSIAHDALGDILQKEVDLVTSLPNKKPAKRTQSDLVNRYTLPKNGNRYKTICLICGSDDVRLPSLNRLDQAGVSKSEMITNDLGLHLVKSHLSEFFPFLSGARRSCDYCSESFKSSSDSLLNHFVKQHSDVVIEILKKFISCGDKGFTQLSYLSFFSGYENDGFFDAIQLSIPDLDKIEIASEKIELTTIDEARPLEQVEKLVLSAQGVKRSMNDRTEHHKKAKTSAETSVRCYVCDVYHLKQRTPNHMFLHVNQDIKAKLNSSDLNCQNCQKSFGNIDDLAKHIGLDHNNAIAIGKQLDEKELTKRKKQFFDQLSKSHPKLCVACGEPFVKGFESLCKHMAQEHAQDLRILDFLGCKICNIDLSGKKNSGFNTLFHHLVEHPEETSLEKELLRSSKGKAGRSMCCICNQAVDNHEATGHVMTHFFVSCMVPLMGKVPPDTKFLYGNFSLHEAALLDSFLQQNTDIQDMLESPVNFYKLQHDLIGLMQGGRCIFCLATLDNSNVTAEDHMRQHILTSLTPPTRGDSLGQDEYECQLCDGYPEFGSLASFKQHNLKEHCDVGKCLKTLDSVNGLALRRKQMGITAKSIHDNLNTRSLSSDIRGDGEISHGKAAKLECPFEGCKGYASSEFISHFSDHLYENLVRDLALEHNKAHKMPTNPLKCPRDVEFSSENFSCFHFLIFSSTHGQGCGSVISCLLKEQLRYIFSIYVRFKLLTYF